ADPWPADHRREGHGAQGAGRAEGRRANAGDGDEREGVADRRGRGSAGGLSRATGPSGRLALLRQHPILSLKVTSGVGDELAVAWMIDGFHADDDLHQPGIMLADVLDQLGLGMGWPRDENRAGVCDRLLHSLKEGVVLRGVPVAYGVCLMVNVLGRMIRMQHEPFHIGRTEMEHARFMVIDPDDGMKVMARHGMGPFAGPRARPRGLSTTGAGARCDGSAVAPLRFSRISLAAANGLLSFPSMRQIQPPRRRSRRSRSRSPARSSRPRRQRARQKLCGSYRPKLWSGPTGPLGLFRRSCCFPP